MQQAATIEELTWLQLELCPHPALSSTVAARWIQDGSAGNTKEREQRVCGGPREREPWEAADGGAYLVRELAGAAPEGALPALMPLLARAAAAHHFAHACHLQVLRWWTIGSHPTCSSTRSTLRQYARTQPAALGIGRIAL